MRWGLWISCGKQRPPRPFCPHKTVNAQKEYLWLYHFHRLGGLLGYSWRRKYSKSKKQTDSLSECCPPCYVEAGGAKLCITNLCFAIAMSWQHVGQNATPAWYQPRPRGLARCSPLRNYHVVLRYRAWRDELAHNRCGGWPVLRYAVARSGTIMAAPAATIRGRPGGRSGRRAGSRRRKKAPAAEAAGAGETGRSAGQASRA